MSYLIICLAALVVSTLTLFSGFGLGTLLMPVFALFFPVEVAVAATAMVHLANNLFKATLFGRQADPGIVARFALPAALAAIVGALLLNRLSGMEPIMHYTLGSRLFTITWLKSSIGILILGFSLAELWPGLKRLSFPPPLIPLGGIISGFFGGLSGHQGALRTAFLLRAGLSKESLIGTMILSAIVVDLSRMLVYGTTFFVRDFTLMQREGLLGLVAAGTLAAFVGTFSASRFLKKMTLHSVQTLVGVLLLLLALALGTGLL
ncbi:sulfite exporter TauE/SafE family protein [Thiovibrio frasassiensis]|uniref:Probable membrane transporter protein n=1 Tax=Thiovibrio frasassiensis TaxID=2984131 RepID=A0A9X4MJ41_9BACT|nr:sulfite exporter TauE/SafE family protein [Thiovibrio frasassiensis]MDG4476890.1 sulfite exporter TauE/SafE family protein [Thiovibrio frasassiensis]